LKDSPAAKPPFSDPQHAGTGLFDMKESLEAA